MKRAAASHKTPAPPDAGARGEAKAIISVVGGAILAGAVLQQIVTPSGLSFVLFTLAATTALAIAALASRGRLLAAVAGFRLAAVNLGLLAVASALGTLIRQGQPASFYEAEYGAMGAPMLRLHLQDLFHSFWFGGMVAVMGAGLVVSAARRWPVTRRNAGFFSAHLGILVTLAGTGLSAIFGAKGQIDLHVGEMASTAVVRSGLGLAEEVPLGASVGLLSFDLDRWADQPRISLYLPAKDGSLELKTSFENELGVRHPLPGHASMRIKAFFPDFVLHERLVEPGDAPALELSVDGTATFLVPGKRPRVDGAGGKVIVLFDVQRPKIAAEEARGAPLHTLKGASGEPKPIRVGETIALEDGTRVKALRFFPHFSYDLESKQAMNLSDAPVNPALEVEADGTRRWLFAKMPGFGHRGGPPIVYSFSPEGGSTAATVLAVSAADRTVLVREPFGAERTVPLEVGLEIAGVRFGALHEKASIVGEPGTASQEMNRPAALVELSERGRTREILMTPQQPEPVKVGGAFLKFETKVPGEKAFRSRVEIREGGEPWQAVIAVNHPVSVGPWELYQADFRQDDPTYSGLEAVRDPGVSWVFTGFGLLFFGVAYMFYVAPLMRRKEA